MAGYCTIAEVRERIITGTADADITNLITDAGGDLDDMLGGTTFSTAQKKRATVLLVKAFILEKGQDSYGETESRRQLQEAAAADRALVRKMVSKQIPRWRVKDSLNE